MTTIDEQEIDVHPVCDACWETERLALLNASTRAAEFGLHSFQTLGSLVAQMRGGRGHGPDPESPLIVRGHALEDDAIDMVRKLRPTWDITPNRLHFVHRGLRLGATPDALVADPAVPGVGVAQIKVVSASIFRRQWEDGTPPIGYLLQASQEMMLVPGCTWGAVCALVIGDFTFHAHVYAIKRDAPTEARLLESAAKFWEAFDAGDQPVIDFERDGALIALMFPNETPGKIIDLTGNNMIGELLDQRESLKDVLKDAGSRLTAVDNEIKVIMGDAEAALVDGWRLTHKTQKRKGYVVEDTSFRVLRATKTKAA